MKVYISNIFLVTIIIIAPFHSLSQGRGDHLRAPYKSVCYGSSKNENTYIAPPAEFFKINNRSAKTQSATIEVEYINFSSEAQTAFQFAVEIWESLIESDVPIKITAYWEQLGAGVLGAAGPDDYVSNFDGAPRRNIAYPIALAEKISGKELNEATSSEIGATFNSNFGSWYFGTDGQTPEGKYDFVTIVLHEIGHGLGVSHAYTVFGTTGTISSSSIFNGFPVVFESHLENNIPETLITTFSSPSTAFGAQLTSNNLFFNGPNVLANNSGTPGKIYAPTNYSGGSSIAHLDELEYPAGDPNSLMSPQIGLAESIHNPGPIVMGILHDIGWSRTQIKHTKINSSEDETTPFDVMCNIVSDITYDNGSLTMFYKIDGGETVSTGMVNTGTADEYKASIPATGSASVYQYYISVSNSLGQEVTNPGMNYVQGQPVTQQYFKFLTGPDLVAPTIAHVPKPFLLVGDTELEIEAVVTDNIELQSVSIEYLINDVSQSQVLMSAINQENSTYSGTMTYPAPLVLDDIVKYRIIAVDNSLAQNTGYFPKSEDYITLKAEALAVTQDSYVNDFNSPGAEADFFGDDLFSVIQVSGFENPALHTSHPYPNGEGPDSESEFVYQLKTPIRLKEGQATLRFEEIVLIEPGESGSIYGGEDFYDYVVAEGSKNGGQTWFPLSDGYDSRSQGVWRTIFNSQKDAQNNSTAIGDPTLFRTRTIDMLSSNQFSANDEIVIRFKLFTDPFVIGWGWVIDNIRIQIDETPPRILHDQVDYILSNSDPLPLNVIATDINGVQSISIDYAFNDGDLTTYSFLLSDFEDQYVYSLDISAMMPGDILHYTMRAVDENGNIASFPEVGSFAAPFIDFEDGISQYATDFSASTDNFAGNFFTIDTPINFAQNTLHSKNDYPVGFGLEFVSDLECLIKKPVIVSANNPVITFDEIGLIAPDDYVVVEASKDMGITWVALTGEYNSQSISAWTGPWLNLRSADSTLFRKRTIDLVASGDFVANDKILVRFRLRTNETVVGWGWAIDNLNIQAPVTAVEPQISSDLDIIMYPNPASDILSIKIAKLPGHSGEFSIIDVHGRNYHQVEIDESNSELDITLYVAAWPSGMYLLRTSVGSTIQFKKVIIRH